MTPRPFQARALAAVGDRLRAGARAVVLVSPTGSGKTCMGAMMAARWAAAGKRLAWGAHREEICLQAARTLRAFGLEVGYRGAGGSAPVQIGTYQEWCARGGAPEADVLVADECHHLGDRVGWQAIARAYRDRGARLIGLTATPARADGRALPDFDSLVVAAQIRELQAEGLLVPLRWRGPSAELAGAVIAQRPVDAYLAEARGRCAVVFAAHLRAAAQYADDLEAAGVRVGLVSGSTPEQERAALLERHRTGDLDVLCTVSVLTEGWDNPRCDCVIVARGCGSPALWIQMAGRGLRPHPGKTECLLLDLRGVAHSLGRPDAEATYSLEGAGIALAHEPAELGPRLCRVCRAPLGDEYVCSECGKDHTPPIPRATGAQLSEWQDRWSAARAALRPSRTASALAGILRLEREAARRGTPWKPSAAAYRFGFIFHRPPTPRELSDARNLLHAAEGYQP